MKVYKSVDQIIGNTPLLELCNIQKELGLKAKIFAKLEYLNPAGSVKDRVAKAMLDDAESKGLITKGATIIEPTSGNTGIGLASIGASRGYKVILTMPNTMSKERIKLLQAYGAEVVLTDGSLGMQGAIDKAEELHKSIANSFIPSQFSNPANPQAHYLTTANEIWADTDGNADVFVATIGSAGTISGTAKRLKELNPSIQVIGVEPQSSPLISMGYSGAHKIQGIGANFLPKNLDLSVIDKVMTVSDQDAYHCARLVAKKQGVLVGISSGGALAVGISLAKLDEYANKNIVVVFPDTGDRYLSCDLF